MQSTPFPQISVSPAVAATACKVPMHLTHMVNPAVLESRMQLVAERMKNDCLDRVRRRRCVAVIGQHILKEIGNARVA
jgi:hypothetical protein